MSKEFKIGDIVYAYVRDKGYIVKGKIFRKDTVETYKDAVNVYYYIGGEVMFGDKDVVGLRVQLDEIHESLIFDDECAVKAYSTLM